MAVIDPDSIFKKLGENRTRMERLGITRKTKWLYFMRRPESKGIRGTLRLPIRAALQPQRWMRSSRFRSLGVAGRSEIFIDATLRHYPVPRDQRLIPRSELSNNAGEWPDLAEPAF
jgi:hypothetical protein